MSGAEALAVVSIVANIVAIVDVSVKVYDRAKCFDGELRDIPKEFQEVRRVLPLISKSLQKTASSAASGKVDEDTCKTLRPVLEGCHTKIGELSIIFKNALPAEGASKWTRSWKAILSVGGDKKVKVLADRIWDDVLALTYHHASDGATAIQVASLVSAMSSVSILSPARKSHFIVRYEKDEDFIGRDEVMKEIEDRFETQNRVALAGIGGVGKSRIAIEYCYRFKETHPSAHVLWVHGANKARFKADYKNIASMLKIPGFDESKSDQLALVSDWLSDKANGTWLLILDNVDDLELWVGPTQELFSTDSVQLSVPLIKFVPRGSHGFVLFTTRDIQLGKQLASVKKKPITVLPLRANEACLLLRSKIAEDDDISQLDATDVVQTLDYLPLAITQAAAYLDQTNMTVATYLQLLRTGKADTFDLLKEGVHDPSRDYEIQNSVFQTWVLSFHQLLKQTPRAAEILSLMVTLDRHAIPAALLRQAGEPELSFARAIQKLKAFYLISEENKSSVFSIHHLVQLSVQKWLNHRNELLKWQEAALLTVSKHCPSHNCIWYEPLGAWRSIIPHMEMVLHYEFEDKVCLMMRARLLSRSGSYNCRQKNFKIADIQSSEAIFIRERFLGPSHVRTLGPLSMLGTVYWREGKAAAAEAIFQRVLSHEDVLGPKKTQSILNKLGAVYYDQGRLADAIATYQRALTTNQKLTDPPGLTTLTTLNNLANVYRRQDRLQDAETLLKEVLIRKELLYGDKHPSIFEPLMNLGHIYRAQGRLAEMEEMFRRALEQSEKTLGPEDKNTLAAAYELYSFYTQQGRAIDSAILQKVELLKTMPGPPVPLICDFCEKSISASVPYYSCTICRNGDFDVCQNCVDKGLACLDRTHVLVKGRF